MLLDQSLCSSKEINKRPQEGCSHACKYTNIYSISQIHIIPDIYSHTHKHTQSVTLKSDALLSNAPMVLL